MSTQQSAAWSASSRDGCMCIGFVKPVDTCTGNVVRGSTLPGSVVRPDGNGKEMPRLSQCQCVTSVGRRQPQRQPNSIWALPHYRTKHCPHFTSHTLPRHPGPTTLLLLCEFRRVICHSHSLTHSYPLTLSPSLTSLSPSRSHDGPEPASPHRARSAMIGKLGTRAVQRGRHQRHDASIAQA